MNVDLYSTLADVHVKLRFENSGGPIVVPMRIDFSTTQDAMALEYIRARVGEKKLVVGRNTSVHPVFPWQAGWRVDVPLRAHGPTGLELDYLNIISGGDQTNPYDELLALPNIGENAWSGTLSGAAIELHVHGLKRSALQISPKPTEEHARTLIWHWGRGSTPHWGVWVDATETPPATPSGPLPRFFDRVVRFGRKTSASADQWSEMIAFLRRATRQPVTRAPALALLWDLSKSLSRFYDTPCARALRPAQPRPHGAPGRYRFVEDSVFQNNQGSLLHYCAWRTLRRRAAIGGAVTAVVLGIVALWLARRHRRKAQRS